jgi:hypothetical protein
VFQLLLIGKVCVYPLRGKGENIYPVIYYNTVTAYAVKNRDPPRLQRGVSGPSFVTIRTGY